MDPVEDKGQSFPQEVIYEDVAQTSEIVPAQNSGLMIPLGTMTFDNPRDVIVMASNVARELVNIIDQQKLFKVISGRKYVFVDGWEVLGGMLGLHAEEESSTKREDGAWEATVRIVRNSDGAIMGRGSAICAMDEEWGDRKEYMRKSMATTRATGKAYRICLSWIMRLAGYEATPAEEMGDEAQDKLANQNSIPAKPSTVEKQKEALVRYCHKVGITGSELAEGMKKNNMSVTSTKWEDLFKLMDTLAYAKTVIAGQDSNVGNQPSEPTDPTDAQ